jgi:hypothetical protein
MFATESLVVRTVPPLSISRKIGDISRVQPIPQCLGWASHVTLAMAMVASARS